MKGVRRRSCVGDNQEEEGVTNKENDQGGGKSLRFETSWELNQESKGKRK